MGTGGQGQAVDREVEALYLRSAWEVPAGGLSLGAATRTLQSLDLAYQFAVLLFDSDYQAVDLSKPFWLKGEPALKPEHQLKFISLRVENPLILLALIPAAVLAGKGVGVLAAGATVAVSLEKIIGLPWRLQKQKAEKEKAKSDAGKAKADKETADWGTRKAKAEAELAELKLRVATRNAQETQERIQTMAKQSLRPIGFSLETERPAA
jgi:hypothetical protein